jgi:hypothetical protein
MHQPGFTRSPPTMSAIRKILIVLNSNALEDALGRWTGSLLGEPTSTEFSPS